MIEGGSCDACLSADLADGYFGYGFVLCQLKKRDDDLIARSNRRRIEREALFVGFFYSSINLFKFMNYLER